MHMQESISSLVPSINDVLLFRLMTKAFFSQLLRTFIFQMLQEGGYTAHIMKANSGELAGGYVETVGCLRAVQEAMMGLYFNPAAPPVIEHVVGTFLESRYA